jgi:hypothetical protein
MRQVRRRFLLLFPVLLGCAAAGLWLLAGHLLAPERVARLVAGRLQMLLGTPVQVEQVHVGWTSSSLEGLRFFEAGASQEGLPWGLLEKVQAELPPLDLLFGNASPQELTLEGAIVDLRVDAGGRLQTRLPRLVDHGTPFPTLHLRQGQLHLQQDEHPEFVLTGIVGQLADEAGRLVAEGTVTDPSWGSWKFRGYWDRQAGKGSLTLQAPSQHVTQATLDRLPFVPPKVWKQVQCEGDTPAEMELSFELGAPKPHYRITLRPQETAVHVNSIDLFAEHARGEVIVEDGVVRLNGVQGQAANGLLRTEAALDFRARPAELRFDVRAECLDLGRLPRKWAMPPRLTVEGRLSGQAHLLVRVQDGKGRTSGDGSGSISAARVAGIPLLRPIPLRLHADGNRFHFVPILTPLRNLLP